MRLKPRLRETYLSARAGEGQCITQACGTEVRVWLWSERDNISLNLQTDGFMLTRPYEQSIHRWGVSISRYIADTDDATGVVVNRDGEKPTVEVAVERFEGVKPDV
jgi:hypothetical protein